MTIHWKAVEQYLLGTVSRSEWVIIKLQILLNLDYTFVFSYNYLYVEDLNVLYLGFSGQ